MLQRFLTAAVCSLALLVLAAQAGAADVSWSLAQQISGDSDVSTTGTLVGAISFGGPGTTVNGVTFQAMPITTPSNTVGDFTFSSGFFLGSGTTSDPAAPFSTLSTNYQSLLGNDAVSLELMTLTMSNLTIGQNYQFETWVNDSTNHTPPGFTFTVDVTGGANTVTLDPDPSIAEGGLGQFVLGTFTADSTSQDVTFFNSEVGIVNGFELRAISSTSTGGPSGVPLPAAVWSGLALAAAGLVARRMQVTAAA